MNLKCDHSETKPQFQENLKKKGTHDNHLRINANYFIAFFANVGKNAFVAFNTIRMFIPKNVTLTGQSFVTLPARKVTAVPVFGHGLSIFTAENELEKTKKNFIIIIIITYRKTNESESSDFSKITH